MTKVRRKSWSSKSISNYLGRNRKVTTSSHGDQRVPPWERRPDYSLSEPLITLFVTPARRAESQQAFDILLQVATGFRVQRSDDELVSAEFAGKRQYGIEGLNRLRTGIKAFEDELFRPGSDLETIRHRMFRPGVKEQAWRELQGQQEHARRQLDSILNEA